MSRFFLNQGIEELRHGVELVAASLDTDKGTLAAQVPKGGDKERNFYTVDLIDEVLEHAASGKDNHLALRAALARMLAFDALVGAHDRHAENWGVIYNAVDNSPPRFAPVYDTARGLFVDRSDESLASHPNRAELIQTYACKSRTLIGTGNRADVNHFSVLKFLVECRPTYAPTIKHIVASFDLERLAWILHYRFGRLFSRLRLMLIYELLRFRHRELSLICGLSRGGLT